MRHTSHLILCEIVAAIIAVCTAAGAANAEPVTQCGQSVVEGELTADLDCSAYNGGAAVILEGSLNLNGFTLTGNPSLPDIGPENAIVYCPVSCSVTGPGTIRSGLAAVAGEANVKLKDVTMSDTTDDLGAVFSMRKATLEGCTLDNHLYAVKAKRVRFLGSTASGFAEFGVWAFNTADVRDSSLSNGLIGVRSDANLKMENTNVSGAQWEGVLNGSFFSKSSARISGSTITGNTGGGVAGYGRLTIRDSTITDNGDYGILGFRVKLFESEVAANCLEPQVPNACADLYVSHAPVLTDTSCGTSLCPENSDSCTTGEDWNVCSAD